MILDYLVLFDRERDIAEPTAARPPFVPPVPDPPPQIPDHQSQVIDLYHHRDLGIGDPGLKILMTAHGPLEENPYDPDGPLVEAPITGGTISVKILASAAKPQPDTGLPAEADFYELAASGEVDIAKAIAEGASGGFVDLSLPRRPPGRKLMRWLKLEYGGTGIEPAGSLVTAGLVLDRQDDYSYPSRRVSPDGKEVHGTVIHN